MGAWLKNLDAFPGPFGRVEEPTTELLLQYLEQMAERFQEGEVQFGP